MSIEKPSSVERPAPQNGAAEDLLRKLPLFRQEPLGVASAANFMTLSDHENAGCTEPREFQQIA